MSSENIIKIFFHMQHSIKLYHWQTTSYPRHKATNDLLDSLNDLIDTFVETYIGKYSRPSFKNDLVLSISEHSDDDIIKLFNRYIKFLSTEIMKYVSSTDTDLLNIRDEMLGLFNKTLYLFTLE